MTTSPVCPQERFSLYKFRPSAYPLLKRIGPLAAPQHHLLSLLLFPCCLYQKTHKKLPFSTCSYSLSKITCHYLLLLLGFHTLTYRKGYDRSPTLVGHQGMSCIRTINNKLCKCGVVLHQYCGLFLGNW